MKPVIVIDPVGIEIAEVERLESQGFTVVLSYAPQKVVVHPDTPSQRERIATALLAARIASGDAAFGVWPRECEQAVARADVLIKELNK